MDFHCLRSLCSCSSKQDAACLNDWLVSCSELFVPSWTFHRCQKQELSGGLVIDLKTVIFFLNYWHCYIAVLIHYFIEDMFKVNPMKTILS